MTPNSQSGPVTLVIFGGGGDLARRKLIPALYNLFLDGRMPASFAILGVDRVPLDTNGFRQQLRAGVDQFSRRRPTTEEAWERFAPHLSYLQADLTAPASYATLARRLAELDKQAGGGPTRSGEGEHVFYLATAPALFAVIARQLGAAGLVADRKWTRLVVEKPFGHDLASARAFNRELLGILEECQVYRIDHYLGKETVQNILAFRFANSLFEPVWNRRYINHVQITVAERVGVDHRGGYYDRAGALRDMVQNHLLQVLCLVAMEPPVSFAADEVRNKKVDVLRAIRPLPRDHLADFAVRGQYGPGWVEGHQVPGYRQEGDVAPDSSTETYAALKLFVDNWRWQDVPFYLRTGKRLATRVSEVAILFDPVPHRSFPASAAAHWPPNRLVVRIQPEEDILLRFQAKEPGPDMRLRPVHMRFSYAESFRKPTPEAYETLLLDVIRGDATLFMRDDQVEASWEAVTPVLESWAQERPEDFPNYPAGSWGPEAADALLARDGHHWVVPTGGEAPPAPVPEVAPPPDKEEIRTKVPRTSRRLNRRGAG